MVSLHKVPALLSWCIWHVGTTQDLDDTVYSPHVWCRSQRNHWLFYCILTWWLRRLRFFGHIAHSSPREDHHRALAAAIRQVRPDWKRPIRRPSHTWLRAIQADRGPLNFGLTTAWRQALLEMNSDILWTQQCSSGVHYERRRRCHDLPCLCHIVIARSHFSECHILRVSRTLQLVCVHSPYV